MSDAIAFATPDAEAIYRLRWSQLGLSQAAFATKFGLSYATVQNIEQGRRVIAPLARVVLAAIELDPELMARAAIIATVSQVEARGPAEAEAALSASADEYRYALRDAPSIRLVRRSISSAAPEGTLAMLEGEGWSAAGWFRDGAWTNARKQPLKREPLFWTAIEGTEGAAGK